MYNKVKEVWWLVLATLTLLAVVFFAWRLMRVSDKENELDKKIKKVLEERESHLQLMRKKSPSQLAEYYNKKYGRSK